MNQTKKRLTIIKLAISMTDNETIELQIDKLALLKHDAAIDEILTSLNAKKYAQAQMLITTYIDTPTQSIAQETTAPEEDSNLDTTKVDKAIENKQNDNTPVNYDALLNIDVNKVLENSIQLKTSHVENEALSREKPQLETDLIQRDTFFDHIEESTDDIITPSIKKEEVKETIQEKADKPNKPVLQTDLIEKDTFFTALEISQVPTPSESNHVKDEPDEPIIEEIKPLEEAFKIDITPLIHEHKKAIEKVTQSSRSKVDIPSTNSSDYPPIKNIEQKLEHMNLRYPPVFYSNEAYPSVEVWIEKISTTGYSESDVENVILQIKELSQDNQAEAGQLLLITASTASQYAEFILARELYKGEMIQKNLIEAFNRIHHLAIEKKYPEAICDLAQFYEKGIGTSVDKVLAKTLYEEAMELGIARAQSHVERLSKKQKGFFSKLIN